MSILLRFALCYFEGFYGQMMYSSSRSRPSDDPIGLEPSSRSVRRLQRHPIVSAFGFLPLRPHLRGSSTGYLRGILTVFMKFSVVSCVFA